MHPSSSTTLSDCIARLWILNCRLDNASFRNTPKEELLGLCVAGSMVIATLAETTVVTQFTEEEVDFVDSLTHRIEMELAELYGVPFDPDEGDDSDQWDSP